MKHQKIYAVLIIAFFLRIIALNQSLWLDEATTAQTVKNFSYYDLITRFAPTDFHPPLYYLFMKAWTSIFGFTEIALRMPSVIFSLITGWVVYLIGNKFLEKNAGIWAAAFFLFNPLIVYYSQEARMYMMATCFLTVAIYLYISLVETSRRDVSTKNKYFFTIIFNIFIALSLFTFYGSVFFVVGMYLYVLIRKFRDPSTPLRFAQDDMDQKSFRLLLQILPGSIIAGLILSPLLYTQYMHSKEILNLIPNWSMVLGNANLKNLLLIPIKFSIGRIQFEPKIAYYLGAGIWTFFVFCYIVLGGLRKIKLGVLFILPLFLGFLFSFFTPLLQYFRFVYLIPLYALLVVAGLTERNKRILYISVFILLSCIYVLSPRFHRENWKMIASTIKPDQTVYMVYSSSDPLRYYLDMNQNPATIKDFSSLNSDVMKDVIVVIPYTAEIHGIRYHDMLKENGYFTFITYTARSVISEVWQKQ